MRSGLDGEMKRRWESESLYISPDGCHIAPLGHRDEADRMGYSRRGSSLRASSHTCTTGRGTACSGPCLMLIQSEFESKTSATH